MSLGDINIRLQLLLLEPQKLHRQFLAWLLLPLPCLLACAFVGRAITAGRAAVGTKEPAAGTATAALLAAVAAGNAAVVATVVANATCLTVAGRGAVAAAC
jgi:hypothetical protein